MKQVLHVVVCIFVLVTAARVDAQGSGTLVVPDDSSIEDAMVPANAGRHILIRAGIYVISEPLQIPDGATVQGEGVMGYTDPNHPNIPTGFVSGETIIEGSGVPAAHRAVVFLGDGSTLSNTTVNALGSPNPLAAISLHSSGDVRMTLSEVVAEGAGNFEGFGIDITGQGVDARFDVEIEHSIARGHGAHSIHMANVGDGIRTAVRLVENHTEGGASGLNIVGGGGDARDTVMMVNMHRNLWTSPTCGVGVGMTGGSDEPIFEPREGSDDNLVFVTSVDDTVVSRLPIFAQASQRRDLLATPSDRNTVDARFIGTTLDTSQAAECPPRGIILCAARSVFDPTVSPPRDFPAGDDNLIRFLGRQLELIGNEDALYAENCGPEPANRGENNTFELIGNSISWQQANDGPDAPPDHYVGQGP